MISRKGLKTFFFAFTLFVIRPGAAQVASKPPAAMPWLAQVQSTFVDELNGKDVLVRGAGLIGKVGDRYFVLCASHLSQGQNLQVSGVSETLRVTGRLAENFVTDLELLEIERPTITPIFTYDSELQAFVLRMEEEPLWRDKRGFVRIADQFWAPVPSVARGAPLPFTPEGSPEIRDKMVDLARRGHGITKNALENELITDSRGVPGMSGAPLLAELPYRSNHLLSVEGLNKGFHRYFDRSYFSTKKAIAFLVQKYLEGNRGIIGSARWRFRGISYRDFGDGTLEINPDIRPSGSGESADGGDSAKTVRIKPGMVWKGSPVIGFRLCFFDQGLNRENCDRSVYANKDALEYLLFHVDGVSSNRIEGIPPGESYVQLFRKRMKTWTGARDPAEWSCEIDRNALNDGKILVRLMPPFSKQGLEVGFDSHGKLNSSADPDFQPVVEAGEPNGFQKWTIDVTGIFFQNLAHVPPPGSTADFEFHFRSFRDQAYVLVKSEANSVEMPVSCFASSATSDCSYCARSSLTQRWLGNSRSSRR